MKLKPFAARIAVCFLPLAIAFPAAAQQSSETTATADLSLLKSGGATSVTKTGANAFSMPAANLPLVHRLDFSVGNSFFRNPWVQAPATTDARDGLGPLFNTNGCQNCHIKDGRGHPPEEGDTNAVSMLVRLSIPALTPEQKKALITDGVIPDPIYGGQLQDFALPDVKPEGQIKVTYSDVPVTFSDGEIVTLRKPILTILDLNYGDLHPDIMMSARIAPPMIGLGLLELIPEQTLESLSASQLSENKGISGRLNRVWDVEKQQTVAGRFGWKAGQPTLMQQNASAFNGDLGLTSRLFPVENCTGGQDVCQTLPNGGSPEVSDKIMNFVEFYSRHLAVPVRRNLDDPQVKRGERLFAEAGCGSCHQSKLHTAKVDSLPALSEQTIHPYTDLLLHDMGEGLADHRGEFLANGREWRTAPLWGIGYTKEVNGHTYFLHDGRARNLMEAVLWHGGEAQASRDQVLQLGKQDREALIAFLHSL
ncbi:di-heme oxidoredictase family protein [Photobacterium halotolerans]|uniref:di-heme oxidoreductase family protein n=1 Tax=Photobacterium halotolerans TaxID=265726 RepID=UPI00137279EC|nr:di-heme oxidoredictase family protein [Photobacterium halotolerans]NAW86860.1 c-type cytochrome [Photobacterium halotolerans]